MVEQLQDAGSVLVLVLGYVLLVQVLMAAIVLLGQFIVLQWRALRLLVFIEPPSTVPAEAQGQGEPYRVGGGLLKW
jgi:hypothetical protein